MKLKGVVVGGREGVSLEFITFNGIAVGLNYHSIFEFAFYWNSYFCFLV